MRSSATCACISRVRASAAQSLSASHALTHAFCAFAALEFEDEPDYDRLRQMLVSGIVDAAAFDWEVRAIALLRTFVLLLRY